MIQVSCGLQFSITKIMWEFMPAYCGVVPSAVVIESGLSNFWLDVIGQYSGMTRFSAL